MSKLELNKIPFLSAYINILNYDNVKNELTYTTGKNTLKYNPVFSCIHDETSNATVLLAVFVCVLLWQIVFLVDSHLAVDRFCLPVFELERLFYQHVLVGVDGSFELSIHDWQVAFAHTQRHLGLHQFNQSLQQQFL